MMYPYIVLADETEITHSQILNQAGTECVEVHFERATADGFDSARCVLPANKWLCNEGFSQEEIEFFNEFLLHNSSLLLKYAAQGGIGIRGKHRSKTQ